MHFELGRAFQLVSQGTTQAIKEGEALLQQLRKNQLYPLALLDFMGNTAPTDQLRAAIELRLWCRSYESMEPFERKEYSQVLPRVKEATLLAFLNSPIQVSKTLREGIISLASVEFPNSWRDLLLVLVQAAQQQPTVIAAVRLLVALTDKYAHQGRSDPLYEEIIWVCDEIHDFFLQLTLQTLNPIEPVLLRLLMRLFYNLNFQDLHPKFEDNLPRWMEILKQILSLPNANEAIFKCKGSALEAVLLYASKYREDVGGAINGFCQDIWQLCASVPDDDDADSDHIVLSCLKFFKSLLLWADMKEFFRTNMDEVMLKLVLPNIRLGKQAASLFLEETPTFLDYFFRNTELDTRRAAALELLRVICRHYDTFEGFLQKQVAHYQQLPQPDESAQSTLITLVVDGGCKGFRVTDGCTSLYIGQYSLQFVYSSIVKPMLTRCAGATPIERVCSPLHVACLARFVFYFQQFLPHSDLFELTSLFYSLRTQCPPLKSVQLFVLNALLSIRHGDFVNYTNFTCFFDREKMKMVGEPVLQLLSESLASPQHDAPLSIPEDLSKLALILCRGLQDYHSALADRSLPVLQVMVSRASHCTFASATLVFEAVGYCAYWLLKCGSPQAQSTLEAATIAAFTSLLSTQSDLVTFCIQVLGLFVRLSASPAPFYTSLYDSILHEQHYQSESGSLLAANLQYLSSFLERFPERLLADKTLLEVLFTKLISMELYELFFRFHEGLIAKAGWEHYASSGYLALAMHGAQAISSLSMHAKKEVLFFFSRVVTSQGAKATLPYVRASTQLSANGFLEHLLVSSADIMHGLQTRRDRKHVFGCVCQAISCRGLSSALVEGTLLNTLIENILSRFDFNKLGQQFHEKEQREKKESTYKKLEVFGLLDATVTDQFIDEEQLLFSTYQDLAQNNSPALQCLSQRSADKMRKMVAKQAWNKDNAVYI